MTNVMVPVGVGGDQVTDHGAHADELIRAFDLLFDDYGASKAKDRSSPRSNCAANCAGHERDAQVRSTSANNDQGAFACNPPKQTLRQKAWIAYLRTWMDEKSEATKRQLDLMSLEQPGCCKEAKDEEDQSRQVYPGMSDEKSQKIIPES
ncbi:hypothetical protein LshimejAT787_1402950 [Lyophyllum shimeji]|uniref:Uncharacterized protein n=1 Tax=Lyophyllum shimeji TaxID=47721 RepID=A0A9P3PXG8_LYOSH|nr:hypothetical protein LshimejAT787_1402950 [Lyophyllum shimeji]